MKAFSTAIANGALGKLKNLYLDENQIGDDGSFLCLSCIT